MIGGNVIAILIPLLMAQEGFSAKVYSDAGHWAIGYGHQLTVEEIKNKTFEKGITKKQARLLLEKDIKKTLDYIIGYCPKDLNENQIAAITSLAYNIGVFRFLDSDTYRELINGDMEAFKEEFKQWRRANGKVLKGLEKRRAKELELFFS